jgi:hypothetical protein
MIIMGDNILTTEGLQIFEEIRRKGMIYVDKTEFLAKMIDEDTKIWFLARPRRFGKSLTVSTLECLFSGERELFRGLYIENKLKDELYAPRPVIHLDMSAVSTHEGSNVFEENLRSYILRIAKKLNVEVEKLSDPAMMFSCLIEETFNTYNSKVAILIDEYDNPITVLLENMNEMNTVRKDLQDFYVKLNSNDKFISFVFVTGITQSVKGGLYPGFNNATDISFDPEYGAITGFTEEEIQKYYKDQIQKVASSRKMNYDELVGKMKEFYYGFCFDGQTFVYNPFSTLLFFWKKDFSSFWYDSGSSDQIISFFRTNLYHIQQFHHIIVDKSQLMSPSIDRNEDHAAYLYQLGYLSQKTGAPEGKFKLGYPNIEVSMSLARGLLANFFATEQQVNRVYKKTK